MVRWWRPREPVLETVPWSKAPIFRSCFTRVRLKQYSTNMPWLSFSRTNGQTDTSLHHKMSSHLLFNAVILSAMRQGQEELLCVQVLGVSRQRPSFESLKKWIVCFDGNTAHNKSYVHMRHNPEGHRQRGSLVSPFNFLTKTLRSKADTGIKNNPLWRYRYHTMKS